MAFVERFSDRVEDYARYRPSYPPALLDLLEQHGLESGAAVMDAGSGTGILSSLLLDRGATVYGVEPNGPMRAEAERRLADRSNFISVPRTAEDTGLANSSIDLITAAQAFHWFDVETTRKEWQRILKPGGWVALIWNERIDETEFSRGYREMAHAFVDQQGHAVRRLVEPDAKMKSFFGTAPKMHQLANYQEVDLNGLIGRALSSSYWPKNGPAYDESIAKLTRLFELYNREGRVRFDYVTQVFLGQLQGSAAE